MASLFKCHSCNAITDISKKDRRLTITSVVHVETNSKRKNKK